MAKHADPFNPNPQGTSNPGTSTPSIALLPSPTDELATAVREGGGVVEPLSDATEGLVLSDAVSASEVESVIAAHPGIRWIQLYLAGVDQYDALMRSNPTKKWTSGKGAFGQPVGEFAITLTLAMMRGVPTFARAGSWGPPRGTSLQGRNVVLVGAGGVGSEILRLLQAFTEHITVVRAHNRPVPGAERTVTAAGLDEVLATADVVILAAALTAGTANLMDARRLALLKPDSFLINVSRGPTVDTDALVQALAGGKLAGAALDVTDPQPLPDGHPLWSEPRALITPHTAETPEMVAPLLARRVRENVRRFAAGEPFEGLVNVDEGY